MSAAALAASFCSRPAPTPATPATPASASAVRHPATDANARRLPLLVVLATEGERSWSYATEGPSVLRPDDGAVLGFRFALSEDSQRGRETARRPSPSPPPARDSSKKDSKRVALRIDFGTAPTPPGEPRPRPSPVPPAHASPRTPTPPTPWPPSPPRCATTPRRLLCAIDGYPKRAAASRSPATAEPATAEPRNGTDAGSDARGPQGDGLATALGMARASRPSRSSRPRRCGRPAADDIADAPLHREHCSPTSGGRAAGPPARSPAGSRAGSRDRAGTAPPLSSGARSRPAAPPCTRAPGGSGRSGWPPPPPAPPTRCCSPC